MATGAARGNGRGAVITWGSFSGVNDRVAGALADAFSDHDLARIDLREALHGQGVSPWFKAQTRLSAYREYGRLLALGRERLEGAGGCRVRTPVYFRAAKQAVATRLAGHGYSFSLQTQSFFDASVDGIPHFVYTDSADRACLRYPGFRAQDLFNQRWLRREAEVYLNARLVFTMSRDIADCLVDEYGCPPDRVICAYAGPNAEPDPARIDPRKHRRRRILFVGTLWQLKGGPSLLAAFEAVRAALPDAHLTIVGCTPDVAIPNCEVVGRVPVTEMSDHYGTASVFCLPTTREAFANSCIEAFAHGVPVVASRLGAIPDYVEEGRSGYLVQPGDVDGLAARLIDLLGDPERCRAFGEHGRRMVAQRYTWPHTARTIAAHIGHCLED